jgi:peptidoglycan/LPS O-acetylase OafA/YrhL
MARVGGLDSIRFVCAFIVVLFHFGLVSRAAFGTDPRGLAAMSRAVLGCLFDGPAAVIVFFVISGFCIHFPFRRDPAVNIPAYYSRRLIRIGVPALVALCLWTWVGVKLEPQDAGIFWSIICEVEYYLLYPVLLRLRLRFGWWSLIVVSQVLAYILALSHIPDIQRVVGSYSLYLMHPVVPGLLLMSIWLRPHLSSSAGNLVPIFGSLFIAYGFYLVIEAPAHRFAIAVSRRLKPTTPATALAVPDS